MPLCQQIMMSAAFLANFFLLLSFRKNHAISKSLIQPENVDQMWSHFASKVSGPGCALQTEDKRNLFAGMLYLQKAEGNLLQVDTSSQILSTQMVCETISFFFLTADSVCCIEKRNAERTRSHVHEKLE